MVIYLLCAEITMIKKYSRIDELMHEGMGRFPLEKEMFKN
jgi:hypothetical protein